MTVEAQAPGHGVPVDHEARAEAVEWMADTGESAVGAAARIGISREGLKGWCTKHGAADHWRRLAARDPVGLRRNQHDERWEL